MATFERKALANLGDGAFLAQVEDKIVAMQDAIIAHAEQHKVTAKAAVDVSIVFSYDADKESYMIKYTVKDKPPPPPAGVLPVFPAQDDLEPEKQRLFGAKGQKKDDLPGQAVMTDAEGQAVK